METPHTDSICNLYPQEVFSWFARLNQIPRGSGNEDGVVALLRQFAADHGLAFQTDAARNVLLTLPAAEGCADWRTLALEAHMDMVCAKEPDLDFDFTTMPIDAYVEDGWIKAKGTSLGADDGIGAALLLALLQAPPDRHGEIRGIFTTGEEVGMTGARALSPKWLQVDALIGLDFSNCEQVLVSCAGYGELLAESSVNSVPMTDLKNRQLFRIRLIGLAGGHSGKEIHRNKGNAIAFLADVAYHLIKQQDGALLSFSGGTALNVIPRESEMLLSLPKTAPLDAVLDESLRRLRLTDPEASFSVSFVSGNYPPFHPAHDEAARFLQLLRELPLGCRKTSKDGTRAELSMNLAKADYSTQGIQIGISMRSNSSRDYLNLRSSIIACGNKFYLPFQERNRTPVWEFSPNCALLKYVLDCGTALGRNLTPAMIHAGVEEGIFLEIAEKAGYHPDMVGLGCTTLEMHTTRERLEAASVGKTYSLLQKILNGWR